MRTKLLKRLRKKAKKCTWVKYENGLYRAYKKNGKGISYTFGVHKLNTALRDLYGYRRDLVLDCVDDMKADRINKEIRNL